MFNMLVVFDMNLCTSPHRQTTRSPAADFSKNSHTFDCFFLYCGPPPLPTCLPASSSDITGGNLGISSSSSTASMIWLSWSRYRISSSSLSTKVPVLTSGRVGSVEVWSCSEVSPCSFSDTSPRDLTSSALEERIRLARSALFILTWTKLFNLFDNKMML